MVKVVSEKKNIEAFDVTKIYYCGSGDPSELHEIIGLTFLKDGKKKESIGITDVELNTELDYSSCEELRKRWLY